MKLFMNKGWEHYEKMQGILFSTAVRGSHIYRPAQVPLAIICDDDEPTDLSKTSTATTSMAAAIVTASNLAVATMETLPLMDVNNNSHVLSTSPIVPPPPFLLSASGSAGKRTHLAILYPPPHSLTRLHRSPLDSGQSLVDLTGLHQSLTGLQWTPVILSSNAAYLILIMTNLTLYA